MTDCTRRFTRVRVRYFVEMRVWPSSHPACRDGHITVLNERGGFVEIGGDHAVNTRVMLRFGFPISDVLCIGVVRHHEPAGGIGVEFLRLSDPEFPFWPPDQELYTPTPLCARQISSSHVVPFPTPVS